MLIDIVKVIPFPDFTLQLEFKNGEKRRFDMAPYMDQKPWSRLITGNTFLSAHVEYGTVVWSGNIDIDPETLYDYSTPHFKDAIGS
jgi:hypothetical protein